MTRRKAVSKVLELKGFTREQLELEVKKTKDALDQEQERLAGLEQAFKKTSDEFTAKQEAGGVGVAELELFYEYLLRLCRQLERQKKTVEQRREEWEERKNAMVEAYKEQRLFEILRDKIVREEIREANHGEQKETDERFLTRRTGK